MKNVSYSQVKISAGARAMARHINNGGKMHDTVGESIVTMTQELKTLRESQTMLNEQVL